jgi:hypothetical protein
MKPIVFTLATLLLAFAPSSRAADVLQPAQFKPFIERFNADDHETCSQAFPNAQAWEFLAANIPLLECPDKELERTYYFRWWTYRKHIKSTPDGYVITEFLPPVGWASKHNTISCALGHHLYEGRWIRDSRFLDDCTIFWLRKGTGLHRYSHWLADAIWARRCVTGNSALAKDLLSDLVANFHAWQKERRDPGGLFWQGAGADGMEAAIGGDGYRATINSYMFGDALAIAAIAEEAGNHELARQFRDEAAKIKRLVQDALWDPAAQFFKMRPRNKKSSEAGTLLPLADVRELYGYVPWQFHLPDAQFDVAWKQLVDPQGFFAPFGPTTAEQRHRKFAVRYTGHDCQWNGPSWPYATAQTLTALANLLNDRPQTVLTKADYFATLQCYVRSHALREGRLEVYGDPITPPDVPQPAPAVLNSLDKQPWIDENLNPYTGEWIARAMHQRGSASNERGKDYNHSSFCDLVISGLIGLRPRSDETVEVNPLVPEGTWDWFCLDRVPYHGHTLTILWDKTGTRYGKGVGLHVLADGKEIASADSLTRVEAALKGGSASVQAPDKAAGPLLIKRGQKLAFMGDSITQFGATMVVDRCRLAGTRVILRTPTLIGEDPDNQDNRYLQPYLDWVVQFAQERKLVLARIIHEFGNSWALWGI